MPGGGLLQRAMLVPDEPLQITAEYELGLVRQIVERGHELDHAVPIPCDVIELLNIAHATAPVGPCTISASKFKLGLAAGARPDLERIKSVFGDLPPKVFVAAKFNHIVIDLFEVGIIGGRFIVDLAGRFKGGL